MKYSRQVLTSAQLSTYHSHLSSSRSASLPFRHDTGIWLGMLSVPLLFKLYVLPFRHTYIIMLVGRRAFQRVFFRRFFHSDFARYFLVWMFQVMLSIRIYTYLSHFASTQLFPYSRWLLAAEFHPSDSSILFLRGSLSQLRKVVISSFQHFRILMPRRAKYILSSIVVIATLRLGRDSHGRFSTIISNVISSSMNIGVGFSDSSPGLCRDMEITRSPHFIAITELFWRLSYFLLWWLYFSYWFILLFCRQAVIFISCHALHI